ncbi:MAG TPA: FAD/NAD(P)-binding protein, partial [Methylomirabilota bacterium]|nr:FAD/NAD(P)-binding protein [Methylomirabilota bacterium]
MKSTETHRVAIVGAGFAGSLTAAQILRRATGPLEVVLIERRPPFGVGKAFATSLPCHLLNVPAISMSAYPDDPEHLVRWLDSRIKGSKPASGHELFVPRSLYGEYVGETLRSAAERSRARLDGVTGEVVAIETGGDPGRVHLRMRDGSEIAASFAVLAIGNPPPSDPLAGDLEASRRYAPDPWEEGALDGLTPEGTVVTIGSNLTMVDVALALDHRNHRGPILAVSTHGLLPQPHLSRLPPAWTSRIDGHASGPRDLMRAMREETNAARTQGFEWRSVVDSLRPR